MRSPISCLIHGVSRACTLLLLALIIALSMIAIDRVSAQDVPPTPPIPGCSGQVRNAKFKCAVDAKCSNPDACSQWVTATPSATCIQAPPPGNTAFNCVTTGKMVKCGTSGVCELDKKGKCKDGSSVGILVTAEAVVIGPCVPGAPAPAPAPPVTPITTTP
jgi:hypothetical protein